MSSLLTHDKGVYAQGSAAVQSRGIPPEGPARRIRVFVLEDNRPYRDALTHVLADCVSLEVVGSDSFDCAGLANAVAACPDIVLANGAALCGDDAFPQLQFPSHSRIVALGIVDHERQVVAGAERGIVGFLPLEASVEDVIAAIHATARGEFRCSRRGVAAMASRLSILATRATEQAGPVLTLREEEVLGLVDQGLSNKEIAGRLRVEVSTVKNHVHNLLQKLQVPRRGRASAVFRRLTQATSQY